MALDGITVRAIVTEIKDKLLGGRIMKINQPDDNTLILNIKNYDTYKVFMTINAQSPLMYISNDTYENPKQALNFCMLLRKHLGSGRVVDIIQPGLERVVGIKFEHLDDMGDLCTKFIIIEMMGKYSNIIFAKPSDEADKESPFGRLQIIDSIKHVSMLVSSVREVLPGRSYFIPETQDKLDAFTVTAERFRTVVLAHKEPVHKALYMIFTGFSPLFANEICFRSSVAPDIVCSSLSDDEISRIYQTIVYFMTEISSGSFSPVMVLEGRKPVQFSAFDLKCYGEPYEKRAYESISTLLSDFYSRKVAFSAMQQKTADLRKVISNLIERDVKKLDLQQKQLLDTEKRDKYKVYGELLTAFGYEAKGGDKSIKVNNYYTGEDITIPLDKDLTAIENAKKYYDKYAKLKRTYEALSKLTVETEEEIEHLNSIMVSINLAASEQELVEIKEEMIQSGYMKRHLKNVKGTPKKEKKFQLKSKPMHYVTNDGYDIYVGRNNYQNDMLTFQIADGGDWWFHAKKMPGSHVVVKVKEGELPDRVFELAGTLAAHYSSGKEQGKVEIDYLKRKGVKKPAGANPGFVVYYSNYSLIASSDLDLVMEKGELKLLSE